MADATPIEWTDATWNVVTGCSVVSPGCTNCYAMRLAGTRLQHHPSRAGLTTASKAGPVWNGQVRFNAEWLTQPLRWTRPRRIFVAAHGDLFHEGVTDDWLDQIFAVMALSPQHTFQVLTKRPERMREYLTDSADQAQLERRKTLIWRQAYEIGGEARAEAAIRARGNTRDGMLPLANVWLGVSVEDQARADERIPHLLATPAAVRWISAEPLLGPVNIVDAMWAGDGDPLADLFATIDWVVAGGESGPGARPMHPDWARQLRDQCAAAGVPFLFKQWGDWRHAPDRAHFKEVLTRWERVGSGMDGVRPAFMVREGKKTAGRHLDGVLHDAFPEVRP
jgi:protein gp37